MAIMILLVHEESNDIFFTKAFGNQNQRDESMGKMSHKKGKVVLAKYAKNSLTVQISAKSV